MAVTKRAQTRRRDFSVYIRRVRTRMATPRELSQSAVKLLNALANDYQDRLSATSSKLARDCDRRSINRSDLMSACRMVFPQDLAQATNADGLEACERFLESKQ